VETQTAGIPQSPGLWGTRSVPRHNLQECGIAPPPPFHKEIGARASSEVNYETERAGWWGGGGGIGTCSLLPMHTPALMFFFSTTISQLVRSTHTLPQSNKYTCLCSGIQFPISVHVRNSVLAGYVPSHSPSPSCCVCFCLVTCVILFVCLFQEGDASLDLSHPIS